MFFFLQMDALMKLPIIENIYCQGYQSDVYFLQSCILSIVKKVTVVSNT